MNRARDGWHRRREARRDAVETVQVATAVDEWKADLRAKVEVLGPPQSSWDSPNAGEGWLDAIQAVLAIIDGSNDE
jgi:hypothetical protein